MNRRERRALAKTARMEPGAMQYVQAYHCPDCDSTKALEVDEHGIHHLHVYHDATCPRLTGITR